MPFTDIAPPPAPASAGSGIGFSLRINKRNRTCRLTFRAEKQNQLFGGPIAGKKFSAQAGRGADEGLLRLVLDPNGDLEAKASMKGSAYITMSAWDLLPKDKRPAAEAEVKSSPSNVELILKLPSWAKPSGVGGKMEQEFGLKSGKGRAA